MKGLTDSVEGAYFVNTARGELLVHVSFQLEVIYGYV
mgnify:CR=1 FL=1